MNTHQRFVTLIASVTFTSSGALADVLPPKQDSSSLKGKLTAATGKATTLPISAARKGFVLFDLGNLPADVQPADIAQARLRVYFPSAVRPGNIAIHMVTGGWDEKTTAPEPGVSASPIAVFPAASVVAKKFIEVDVTATVQAWRSGGMNVNNGFAFLASGTTSVTIGAKEGSGSGYPCELEVQVDRTIGSVAITAADAGTLIDVTNTGDGGALRGIFGNTIGSVAGVRGESNSTSAGATGVTGIITSTSPGGFSSGVRGINNSTGSQGMGVYGSHAGSGWGVYGFSPMGIGVYGNSNSGFGVYAQSTTGVSLYAVQPVNGTNLAGYFENSNTENGSPALAAVTNGTGLAVSGFQSGIGGAGAFVIVNPTSGNPAVAGITNGSGSAVSGAQTGTGSAGTFTITNFANNNPAIAGITDGTGPVISASQIGTGKAGTFTINNPANISPALTSTTNGAGAAISGTQTGSGSAGSFNVTSPLSTSSGITVTQDGIGAGVSVQLTKSNNNKHGIDVNNAGIGAGVFAQSLGGNGVWGMTKAVSAAAVLGDNTIGEAVVGRVLGDNVNFPDRDGNGIGAVVGRNDLKNGYGIRGFTFGSGGIGVLGQSGISGGVNIAARFENLNGANPSDVLQVRSTGTAALATFQVNNANVARIDSTGRGFFNGGTQTGGADVAEVIPSTGPQPGPGDVVEIDPEHPLHYRLSSSAGSTMVAGVITTLPGVLMNKMADDETSAPALALVGRVPVKIVGEGGPVRPGDLLVASSTPGHAMRAPAEVKPGTVIGKALEPFTGETGTIQMLVMTR